MSEQSAEGIESGSEKQGEALSKKSNGNASLAKVAANRKNALRSTGPKTSEGKNAVKWNALKHGLLSKEMVITVGDGKENRAEFNSLLAHLREDLKPVGVLEEMLVEKIAICYWRLRRGLKCETGEIRRRLDNAILYEHMRRIDEFIFEKDHLGLEETTQKLKRNSIGVQYLIDVLDQIRTDVEDAGFLPDTSRRKLIEVFGTKENGLAYWCVVLNGMGNEETQGNGDGAEVAGATQGPVNRKEAILRLIDGEKQKMELLKSGIEDNESLETEAKTASLALPPPEVIDKILRYETTIERQFYRAMDQLERLQRRRSGEPVPPPLSVEVSQPT